MLGNAMLKLHFKNIFKTNKLAIQMKTIAYYLLKICSMKLQQCATKSNLATVHLKGDQS